MLCNLKYMRTCLEYIGYMSLETCGDLLHHTENTKQFGLARIGSLIIIIIMPMMRQFNLGVGRFLLDSTTMCND